MKRFLLISVLGIAGLAGLVGLAGGLEGPGAKLAEPEVEVADVTPVEDEGIVPPGDVPVSISNAQVGAWPADPEPVRFTDPVTGESVVVPDFEAWVIRFQSVSPTAAREAGRQAALVKDAELITYRQPGTIEEARALARGDEGIQERLIKLRVTAPRATADFLLGDLGVAADRSRSAGREAVVYLSGGVRIEDLEEGLSVEGEALEIQPYGGSAKGPGHFVVRHKAFQLSGDGLDLLREDTGVRLELHRNAEVQVYGNLPDPEGRALIDLGDDAFEPGRLAAEGGAVLVHETPRDRTVDRLRLHLQVRVHAEQEDGRSLDAERVELVASRPVPTTREEARSLRWRIERFEAGGGVIVQYPGTTRKGRPYLVSVTAERMLHVVGADRMPHTVLEGNPVLDLDGAVPFEGMGSLDGTGRLRASAVTRAEIRPARPEELPEGVDPSRYRHLTLKDGARLERRDAGADPAFDTLTGDELVALLKEPMRTPGATTDKNRAVVFVHVAMRGNVRLGGSRMSGTTHRLVADHLDGDDPVLVVEGPNTHFSFHDLQPGQRLVGGADPAPGPREGPTNAAGSTGQAARWALSLLRAEGNVVVRTSLGGATVGAPTLLEGALLTYDRTSDRARVVGGPLEKAHFSLGAPTADRNQIYARQFELARGRGSVEASGDVEGTMFLQGGTANPGGDILPGLARRQEAPIRLSLATNGRIEIHTHLAHGSRRPRRDTEQVIRVEGGVVAEIVSDEEAVDSLRASSIEAALVREFAAPGGAPSSPLARAGTPAAERTATRRIPSPSTTAEPLVRWDLETQRLTAHFDESGLQRLDAQQGIHIRTGEGQVRGTRASFDGPRRLLRMHAGSLGRAWAAFGPPETQSEVTADLLTLTLGDDGPSRLVASAPVQAILLRREEDGSIERFRVASWADVVVTSDRLSARGGPHPIEIHRRLRAAGSVEWSPPAILWAREVGVEGRDLLSGRAADVWRVAAWGPDTRLRAGAGDDLTIVWGNRFELDVASATATLTGRPGLDLRVQRGLDADPLAVSEQSRIVLDLDTGMIRDLEHPRLILRGTSR